MNMCKKRDVTFRRFPDSKADIKSLFRERKFIPFVVNLRVRIGNRGLYAKELIPFVAESNLVNECLSLKDTYGYIT